MRADLFQRERTVSGGGIGTRRGAPFYVPAATKIKRPKGIMVLTGFLFLMTWDGGLRKWVLPGAEQLLFIAKDMLLFALIAYFFMIGGIRASNFRIPEGVKLTLGLYTWIVLLQGFNPSLPNMLVGIWGIKAHLLYMSLILLLPLAFADLDGAFDALIRIYPWVTIPACLLAFVQVTQPADSFLNQQVRGGMEGISHFGSANLVRVAGPFSYISGMASFLEATALMGMALFVRGARDKLFLCGLCCVLLALPVTGSRSVIVVAAAGGFVIILAAFAGGAVTKPVLIRTLATIGIMLVVSLTMQDAAWQAMQERHSSTTEEGKGRIISAFTNAFDYFEAAGALGFGSGSANLGSVAFTGPSAGFYWLPPGLGFEEESGRIVIELGVVGWFVSLTMRAALFFWASWIATRGKTKEARAAGMLAVPFTALGVYQGNGVFSPPFLAAAYWCSIGLLVLAERSQRTMKRCARRAATWSVESRQKEENASRCRAPG